MSSIPSRSRSWCFTLNSPPEGMAREVVERVWASLQNANYLIGGLERAPTTGQIHLQGYVHFATQRQLSALKKIKTLPGAHWEVARGTPEQNKIYCSKENNFHECGELPEQGKRTDLAVIKEMVLQKNLPMAKVLEVIEKPNQLKFAEALMKYQQPQPRDPPQVL